MRWRDRTFLAVLGGLGLSAALCPDVAPGVAVAMFLATAVYSAQTSGPPSR